MKNIYTVPEGYRDLFTRIPGFNNLDFHSKQGQSCTKAIDTAARYIRNENGLPERQVENAWIATAQECESIIGARHGV